MIVTDCFIKQEKPCIESFLPLTRLILESCFKPTKNQLLKILDLDESLHAKVIFSRLMEYLMVVAEELFTRHGLLSLDKYPLSSLHQVCKFVACRFPYLFFEPVDYEFQERSSILLEPDGYRFGNAVKNPKFNEFWVIIYLLKDCYQTVLEENGHR